MRADRNISLSLLDEILYSDECSNSLNWTVDVAPRTFGTRRDAAEYFVPRVASVESSVADHAGFWSWLGMYYFAQTAPRGENGVLKLSSLDETFVVHGADQRSYQRRYRHYLWSAWRLQLAHGDSAAFLLDQPLTSLGDIADRVFSYSRIFNSAGVVQFILSLYTQSGKQKPKFGSSRGGLRHLIRVLNQLERTHDVYGMSADALMRVLPPDFEAWIPARGDP